MYLLVAFLVTADLFYFNMFLSFDTALCEADVNNTPETVETKEEKEKKRSRRQKIRDWPDRLYRCYSYHDVHRPQEIGLWRPDKISERTITFFVKGVLAVGFIDGTTLRR